MRGRFFSDDERLEHDKFIIVNQELVRQDFPGEDPIGKHLRVDWRTSKGEDYEISVWLETRSIKLVNLCAR